MRQAVLGHVAQFLIELPGQNFFSCRVPAGTLQSLASALASEALTDEDLADNNRAGACFELLGDDGVPERAKDIVFFSVLDQNPAAAVRTRVGNQQQLPPSLKTVSVHRVLAFEPGCEACTISMWPMMEIGADSPEFVPMTLHPTTISTDILRRYLYVWTPTMVLEMRTAAHVTVPESLQAEMPKVLEKMAAVSAGVDVDQLEEQCVS